MLSRSGTGVRPAARVMMTVWLTSGRAQRGRRAAEGAHARADVVCDAKGLQRVKLLAHRAVDAGVSGVQANGRLPGGLGVADHVDHLLQRHFGAVVDRAVRLCVGQKLRIDQ